MRLSIVMPVLDEAATIAAALAALVPLRERGAELIVVDGGRKDETVALVRPFTDLILTAPRGRAAQMNAGARQAKGDVLLFLHADARLPEGADRLIFAALARPRPCWGRFDVTLLGKPRILRLVAFMMNLRSRISGVATGDQAIFMRAEAFGRVGGYRDIALMEDIAMSKALRRLSRPVALAARVAVSGRRFEAKGPMRLIWLMWRLRLAYWLGADPTDLARRYGYVPREG
jgi:rSAM/selenodomain-associated transferase 2